MKIVLAVDGSKYGRWATEWLAHLPFATALQVTALHVVDLVSLRAPFMSQPIVVGIEPFIQAEAKRLQAQGKRVAAEAKALLSSLNIQGKAIAERGAVAPTILKHVRRGNLVVLGHRGLHALDRFLLGSVSSQVTLHAPCSVLVVKEPPRPIRRVLLAADGSKASDMALRFVVKELRPRLIRHNDV
ncbi:MAG: universal stress protein, partial [Nitrospirae bacterium]|nr:universal stress protein [Nitrospirota bacterium]